MEKFNEKDMQKNLEILLSKNKAKNQTNTNNNNTALIYENKNTFDGQNSNLPNENSVKKDYTDFNKQPTPFLNYEKNGNDYTPIERTQLPAKMSIISQQNEATPLLINDVNNPLDRNLISNEPVNYKNALYNTNSSQENSFFKSPLFYVLTAITLIIYGIIIYTFFAYA